MQGFHSAQDPRLPLYQKIRDEIMLHIAKGEWKPETAIPTETQLSESFHVAIGTVRKAIEQLVLEGVLEKQQGKGTFVCRLSLQKSFLRFFSYQGEPDSQEVPNSQVLTKKQIPMPTDVALKLNAQGDALYLERIRILNNIIVLFEEIYLPLPKFSHLLDIPKEEFGNLLYPFYENVCHHTVASATEILTIEASNKKYAQHLNIAPTQPLVVVERTAYGYDQSPLEWRRSYGNAQTFRYKIQIS